MLKNQNDYELISKLQLLNLQTNQAKEILYRKQSIFGFESNSLHQKKELTNSQQNQTIVNCLDQLQKLHKFQVADKLNLIDQFVQFQDQITPLIYQKVKVNDCLVIDKTNYQEEVTEKNYDSIEIFDFEDYFYQMKINKNNLSINFEFIPFQIFYQGFFIKYCKINDYQIYLFLNDIIQWSSQQIMPDMEGKDIHAFIYNLRTKELSQIQIPYNLMNGFYQYGDLVYFHDYIYDFQIVQDGYVDCITRFNLSTKQSEFFKKPELPILESKPFVFQDNLFVIMQDDIGYQKHFYYLNEQEKQWRKVKIEIYNQDDNSIQKTDLKQNCDTIKITSFNNQLIILFSDNSDFLNILFANEFQNNTLKLRLLNQKFNYYNRSAQCLIESQIFIFDNLHVIQQKNQYWLLNDYIQSLNEKIINQYDNKLIKKFIKTWSLNYQLRYEQK